MRAAAGATVATILLWVLPVTAGAFCTDGVDCYCDRVRDPADSYYDPNLIICEDFEDPTYENPDPDSNNWRQTYGEGTTPCSALTNNGTLEGATHNCRNILQRPGCPLYNAGDPDLNESGGHSTLNGEWDGCQSWYFPVKDGGGRGGSAAQINLGSLRQITTISVTMVKKYSSNHWIGAQEILPPPASGNIKGDRYYTFPFTNNFHTPQGGKHGESGPHACSRGSSDPAFGYPGSAKFPFGSLIKPNNRELGIDGRGLCCEDNCFADAVGPTGLPRIGVEEHDNAGRPFRVIMPPRSLWNPRVPGGIPMSVIDPNDATADQDGRDEWFCFQWTIRDVGTNQMAYYHWVNNVPIIRMENLKGSTDNPFGERVNWLNLWAPSTDVTPENNSGEDYVEVRDNYHLTASATPASCAQVGFSFGP